MYATFENNIIHFIPCENYFGSAYTGSICLDY